MRRFAVSMLAVVLLSGACFGQDACPKEPASLKPTEPDIFNDQQEEWLGEAAAETIERQMRFAPAAENVYLQAMGERMLSVLPPTGVHYQFRIYESGEINSFGIGGGRIYISRKIIAALKNEDELAGLLAHEIGHNLAHQEAVEMTAIFREWLGVTSVTDRADIFAKFHALDKAESKRGHWKAPSEEHNQDVADQVAIFAMMRAGYSPTAYAEVFDRTTANKGKTGNVFTDLLFGNSTEDARRYRADLKMAKNIPAQCMAPHPVETGAFAAWQRLLAERSVKAEDTSAAQRVLALQDPLRADLRMIRFSPDGKYLLAQDYAMIFVLQREPLKVLFTIDAANSMLPHFTPDSSKVVFVTNDLRVEHWDVASQKRVFVKEMILPEGCDAQELSPDGHTLMCQRTYAQKDYFPALSVALWSVDTNETIYSDPNFINTGPMAYAQVSYLIDEKEANREAAVDDFSPDSSWFLVALFGKQLLVHLPAGVKVNTEHGIGSARGLGFTFLGDGRILLSAADPSKSTVLTFPEGRLVKTVDIGRSTSASGLTDGNYVMVGPIKDNAVGILSLDTNTLVAASKYAAADVYSGELATQTPRGGVQLNTIKGGKLIDTLDLPQSRLGGLTSADITPDGKYLAVSTAQRSAIWSLQSGKRMGQLRPYSRLTLLPDGDLYFDFLKFSEKPRTQGTVNLAKGTSADAAIKIPEKGILLGNLYVLKKPDDDKKPGGKGSVEFYDLATGKLAWSRRFEHTQPTIYLEETQQRIGMWWEMSDKASREQINSDPVLGRAMEASGPSRDGMVLQLSDAKTGTLLETIAVKEHKPKAARDVRELLVFGDYLLVQGENANTVIYRLSDKAKVGEVYGQAVAADRQNGLFALSNRRNEIFVLDAATAKEVVRYTLSSDVRMATFLPDKKQLLVLTAEQKVYTFDMSSAASATTTPVATSTATPSAATTSITTPSVAAAPAGPK